MDTGSKQDGDGLVNMTRAMEALSPWLNHPRRTITRVEALVATAAGLLLLQLILGSCRRRWHNSIIKYVLQASTAVMNPLIIYTLGTMQSSPIKNSSYPIWAGFLIMASAGTTAVRQYGFCDNFGNKFFQVVGEYLRDFFYMMMLILLMDPNTYTMKTTWDPKWHLKNSRASSNCVAALVSAFFVTKFWESLFLVVSGYKKKGCLFIEKKSRRYTVASHILKCCKFFGVISIEQIREYYGNLADGNTLKDLCISFDLFLWLLKQQYFGHVVNPETSRPIQGHDFVFKKLLPPDYSEVDFKRAFRIIEVELGFCYDFFFTKKSLVLETPDPIIEVRNSQADYIITLLVLIIALLVEVVQAAFFLASNWAQVSLAYMHVKKCGGESNAYIFGEVIGLLRWVMVSQQLRNKIDQHSVIFRRKQQPGPVEVSDAVKKAIARSLRSTYANNLTTNEKSRLLQNQMLGEYSWALNNHFSQLEVMFIWHIATEYCNAISDDPNNGNGNGTTPSSNHRDVAVHLSRYCAYLIGYVPELLPYHEADIAELAQEVIEEQEGAQEGEVGLFRQGVKLGKQLKRGLPDGDRRWEVLQDFWAKTTIRAAASHYTTEQHMQHLGNGGGFLTHIWALLAHAGILKLNRGKKDQEDQSNNLGSGTSAATC
ncbi:unnamed protein product [Urochloa humidicola]